jgi:hypothetical protein
MRLLSKILASASLVSALAFVPACGGASDSPPGPLATHFDEMHIAQIGVDQKTAIVNAQQAWQVARMENAKAEADLADLTNSKIPVARNELKTLRIGVDTAITQKKSAQQSADTNRINQAAKDQDVAEKLERAGVSHVKYLEAYQAYKKVEARYTAENMYWLEAKFELAKAQLAQGNHIAPVGVKFESYPGQEQERAKRVERAKAKWESQRASTAHTRDTWLSEQKAADAANGNHPTSYYDPMAPAAAPAPAPAAPAPAPAP